MDNDLSLAIPFHFHRFANLHQPSLESKDGKLIVADLGGIPQLFQTLFCYLLNLSFEVSAFGFITCFACLESLFTAVSCHNVIGSAKQIWKETLNVKHTLHNNKPRVATAE